MKLFELFGYINVDNDEANQNIDETDKKGSSLGKTFKAVGGGVAKAGAVMATGIGVAVGAVTALTSKAAETTDRVDKMSKNLGFSAEGFQEWDFILSQSGASIDSLDRGMATLSKQFIDAADGNATASEAFKKLGLQMSDLEGLSQEEIFEKTIEGLQQMGEGAERTALASQLLGGSAKEMGALLNSSAEDVANMKNQANAMGLVLGGEVIANGVALTDTLDQMKRTVMATVLEAFSPMIPVIMDLLKVVMEIIPVLLSFIAPLAEQLIPVVGEIITGLLPILSALLSALMPILTPLIDLFLMLLTDALMPIIEALMPIITALLPPLIALFTTLMDAILPILIDVLVTLVEALAPLLVMFAELIGDLIPYLVPAIEWLADILSAVLGKAVEGISKVIELMIASFKKGLDFLKVVFAGDWEKAWEMITQNFKDIFGNIVKYAKAPINAVIGLINSMISRINTVKINIPDWVPEIGGKTFGFNVPRLPMLAKGGTIASAGMAIVGEEGPELVNLPTGASVIPNKQSLNGITIQKMYVQDGTDFVKKANKELKRLQVRGSFA